MTSGQDVSEYLDHLSLVKSYFFKFFEKKKCLGVPTSPEDQAICLFAGLLSNPDMSDGHLANTAFFLSICLESSLRLFDKRRSPDRHTV